MVMDAARTVWASYTAWRREQDRKERYAAAIRLAYGVI